MIAAALALFAVAALAQDATARADVDLKGKLYRAVFFSGPGALKTEDLTSLPEPARERLNRFLVRRGAFTSKYTHDAGSFEQARVDAKKRDIERAIVALIDTPGVDSRALEFVKAARIAVDWQRTWEGPLDEAAAAEEFLKQNPSTPIAPYLYLFIAQRQRAAFEAYAAAKNVDGMKTASRKYRTLLQRSRSVEDPIFALLADDLDRQPYVYLKSDQHPSTFDPDA